ncbi:minor tail protein [Gordonia phage Morgana]|uniref:Minor tail protein n=1 Tax=Gordonia phage Morgana TaxID=3137292 RepID=A0AAX4RAK9_9CAUD
MSIVNGSVIIVDPAAPSMTPVTPPRGGTNVFTSPGMPGGRGPKGDDGDPGGVASVNGRTGTITLTGDDVGLDQVNNTSDLDKPISQAAQEALEAKVDTADARLSDARTLRTVNVTTATAVGTAAKVATGPVTPVAGDVVKLTLTSGNSIGAPTLAVNGGTAYPIRIGNLSSPPSTSVSITAGGIMLLYFDGAIYHLMNVAQPQSEISDAEITAGTATTPRLITGRRVATIVSTARSGVELQANKGVANGYPSLDAGGKIPVSQLPSSLMEYQGVWNAATNTPTLVDGTGNTGDVYRVTAAATRNLGSGAIEFAVGDYVIYNPSGVWEKSDTTDAVASVAGLIGVITAAALRTALSINNLDNTSDANKPVSTQQASALAGKRNLISSANAVYATDASGNQIAGTWSVTPDANTVAVRDGSGRLPVATGVASTDAVNKGQLDGKANTSHTHTGMVTSASITDIWYGTQAEYDAITTKLNSTAYLVRPA